MSEPSSSSSTVAHMLVHLNLVFHLAVLTHFPLCLHVCMYLELLHIPVVELIQVLGVRQGHLDLHGCPRNVTWTRLASTAQANTSTLTLQQDVDWRAGDRIVIAPTGKNGNETEVSPVHGSGWSGNIKGCHQHWICHFWDISYP